MKDAASIKLTLTNDEALVLFDLLTRINNKGDEQTIFEDEAEQMTFWTLEAQLEKTLVDPFKPNYTDLVKDARRRIKDQ